VLSIDLIVFSSLLVILVVGARQGAMNLSIIRTVAVGLAKNPMIVAIALGLGVAASGLTVPAPVNDFLTILGNAATPGALFAIGASKHFLELNALVLCGTDPLERIREDAHLTATAQRFYEEDRGTISDLAAWYALHRDETAWTRAAGVYVRLLSEPQLFIEGNHRTGALIMSCILVRDGQPPFVLSIDNAQGYFDPSTLITKTKKTPIGMLFRIPKLKKEFASFLRENADDRYLLHRAVTPAA